MAQPFVRVDVWTLPAADPILTAYADAVAAMKAKPATDPTSWAYQAAIHGTDGGSPACWMEPMPARLVVVRGVAPDVPVLLRTDRSSPGDRERWSEHVGAPVLELRRRRRAQRPPEGVPEPDPDRRRPNPLYAHRHAGINAGGGLASSITSPTFALNRATFTGSSEFGGGVTSPLGQFWSQTGRLEQTPHNDVHVAIGGLMGDPDTAAEDPIFWLHHANIDRLWWRWQRHHTDPTKPAWTGQSFGFMDVGGVPASLTGAGIEDIVHQLGYTYDHVSPPVPAPVSVSGRPPVRWPSPWPDRLRALEVGRARFASLRAPERAELSRFVLVSDAHHGCRTGIPPVVDVRADRCRHGREAHGTAALRDADDRHGARDHGDRGGRNDARIGATASVRTVGPRHTILRDRVVSGGLVP